MTEFKKYSSIENTYDKEFMEQIRLEEFDTLQFVVQEKVHGANCCFVTDGLTVRFGKRTSLVEAGEKFYNYEELLERYNERIINLFNKLKAKYTDVESIMVYGEMFGGTYPHPDVKNDKKVMNIQKGVFYCPTHEFYGFDLFLYGTEGNRYLTVDETNQFFENGNIFYAKTLFQGTLDECLKYPNAFQSCISQWLGLPQIEGNICEGVVIRPQTPVFFRNSSRVLLKNKNPKFAEKQKARNRPLVEHVEPEYSEALKELRNISEEYVNENRLNNVVSKIGHVSIPREMGKLIGLFSKDALDDFLKEYSKEYAQLEKNEQKVVNTHINKLVIALIKRVYMGGESDSL